MSRKNSGDRVAHVGVALDPTDTERLDALTAAGLTRTGWVRGAIRAAAADPAVAQAIAAAADRTSHGGRRPGAGRPRRSVLDETVDTTKGEG